MKTKLNPDSVFVRSLKKRIRQNNGYCPCAGIFGKGAAATADSVSTKRRMMLHADLSGLRRNF